MKNAKDPTVFIIEDDPDIAKAMQWLLETVNLNVELFESGKSYLEVHDPKRHGCLIIDVRMPGMSGLELQEKLLERKNTIPIIMISGHGDIPMAVRSMKAGAVSFITKPFNDQVLLDEVQKAINLGNAKRVPALIDYQNQFQNLSEREKKIFRLIVDGKLNKEIAHELGIAVSTVELRRSHIMKKMKANSLAQLVKIYLSLGS